MDTRNHKASSTAADSDLFHRSIRQSLNLFSLKSQKNSSPSNLNLASSPVRSGGPSPAPVFPSSDNDTSTHAADLLCLCGCAHPCSCQVGPPSRRRQVNRLSDFCLFRHSEVFNTPSEAPFTVAELNVVRDKIATFLTDYCL